jgi:MFS transporter, putative metabolite transport protein
MTNRNTDGVLLAEATKPAQMSLARIVALCTAGGFLDGYDLLIMSAALLLIIPQFHLVGGQVGLLASIPFIAMAIGSLIAGPLCDRFGRRTVYLVDVMLFLVFAILQAFAQNIWELAIMRFCVGLAIGVDMPTSSSMLAEYSPPSLRGALTSMLNTAWLVGGCVALVVGYVLYRFAGPSAWRWMFAAGAVPALIVAAMRHGLPETPYWTRANDRNTVRPRRMGFGAALGPPWGRPVLFFTLYWMFEAVAGGPPFVYTALIFQQVINFKGADALLLNAIVPAICVVVSLIVQFTLLDRWGRKPFAMLFCALSSAGAIATGFLPNTGIPLVIAFSVFAVASQMSVLPFWPWSTEQLPTHVRATGQSIGSAGGKIGLFVGALLFSPAFIGKIGWTVYFVLVGGIFACLVLYVALFGRETKARALEE